MIPNKIVTWVTRLTTVDRVHSKTQTLREILKIPIQRLVYFRKSNICSNKLDAKLNVQEVNISESQFCRTGNYFVDKCAENQGETCNPRMEVRDMQLQEENKFGPEIRENACLKIVQERSGSTEKDLLF